MIINDLKLKNTSGNYIIDRYFEEKEMKLKVDYDVNFFEIGNTRNLSGYGIVKHNKESVSASKNGKRNKSYFSEVVFAGLRQPTKNISIGTYEILSLFIKRFKVSDIDFCFDGVSEIGINENTLMMYRYLFKDYISSFSDAHREKTSFYINTPSAQADDAQRFKKILVYDKYLKESRHKTLHEDLKNWKRLEVTINIQFKFRDFSLDDYIYDMQKLAVKYFNVPSFGYDYLELQQKLLTDKRTHKGNKIL